MDDEKIRWAPRCSGAAQRRIACELRCDLEMEFRKVGWGDPILLYDEQKELFRFKYATSELSPTLLAECRFP